jgi:hypothetical protein
MLHFSRVAFVDANKDPELDSEYELVQCATQLQQNCSDGLTTPKESTTPQGRPPFDRSSKLSSSRSPVPIRP